ncbi:MAG: STAS domain-containing protein [Burkholderiales bacterium]|nr:STAS domain-containing protein [Burkholderiales bacterium]
MSYSLSTDAASGVHALSGELGIYTVPDIRQQVLALFAAADNIDIDLSGVTEIDTAGLQLMLMTKREQGKQVRFCNHSQVVLKLIDLANLGQTLGDPVFISARSDT